MTGRDPVTICWKSVEVLNLIDYFIKNKDEDIRKKFKTGKDSRDWKIENAINDFKENKPNENHIKPIAYRLFDKRFTFYSGKAKGFHASPQKKIVNNMLFNNIGLLLPRQISKRTFQHVFCTDAIPDMCCFSSETKGANQLFPLYLYHEDIKKGERIITKEPNLTSEFLFFLKEKYNYEFSPEQILGYIYAVLHSQTYREKYFDDLKIDFARIPFVNSTNEFLELSVFGTNLVNAHLLKNIPNKNIGEFNGVGNNIVEKVSYNEKTQQIFINQIQYFEKVTPQIFEFKIGGYEPIDKYLKSRKDRVLTIDEVETVEKIIKVIDFTIDNITEIENLTKEWI
jgi:predicted helicase